jgi:glycosyltransferase 2 family protein
LPRWWTTPVRIVVSVALLGVLLVNVPDLRQLVPAADLGRTGALLGLALLVTLVGIVLSAWRWQRVLAALGSRVGLPRLSAHYLAGQFVSNVLPSTIGGDVVRVARVGRSIGSSETGFASVVLERLTGFIALPLLAVAGFLAWPALLGRGVSWLALAVAGATLASLAGLLLLAGSPRLAGRFRDREGWRRFIGALHRGVDRLRRAPRAALEIVGTAFVYQLSVVISLALLAAALELRVPFSALLAFVPAVAIVQVLPFSIGGLGVREGMFVLFLTPLGVTSAQAIALGLLWYAAVLIVSVLGAPAFALGQRAVRAAVASEETGSKPPPGSDA